MQTEETIDSNSKESIQKEETIDSNSKESIQKKEIIDSNSKESIQKEENKGESNSKERRIVINMKNELFDYLKTIEFNINRRIILFELLGDLNNGKIDDYKNKIINYIDISHDDVKSLEEIKSNNHTFTKYENDLKEIKINNILNETLDEYFNKVDDINTTSDDNVDDNIDEINTSNYTKVNKNIENICKNICKELNQYLNRDKDSIFGFYKRRDKLWSDDRIWLILIVYKNNLDTYKKVLLNINKKYNISVLLTNSSWLINNSDNNIETVALNSNNLINIKHIATLEEDRKDRSCYYYPIGVIRSQIHLLIREYDLFPVKGFNLLKIMIENKEVMKINDEFVNIIDKLKDVQEFKKSFMEHAIHTNERMYGPREECIEYEEKTLEEKCIEYEEKTFEEKFIEYNKKILLKEKYVLDMNDKETKELFDIVKEEEKKEREVYEPQENKLKGSGSRWFYNDEDYKIVESKLNNYLRDIAKTHSNLSMSSIKKIDDKFVLNLYINNKGIIPLGEELFPKYIEIDNVKYRIYINKEDL